MTYQTISCTSLPEVAGELGEQMETAPPSPVPVGRWVMVAALISLNFLDVITTKVIISLGGQEANPIMRPLIDDPAAPFALKIGMCVAVGALLLRAPARSRFADRAVLLAVGVYTLVIGWNLGVLLQASGVLATL